MSTISKYVKVPKKQDGGEPPANEIRLTGTNFVGKYITYAATKLLDKEHPIDSIVLKGTGIAAKGACLVAEILKHRIKNLHQVNEIKTITVVDEYEPTEEGLDHVKIERNLAVLEIHLSRKDGVLDTKAPGYQMPLPDSEVTEEELGEFLQRAERRGGRGGRGGRFRGGRGGRRGQGRPMRGERKGGRIVGGGRRIRRGGPRRDEVEDGERRVQTRDGERRVRREDGEGEDRDRDTRRGGDRPYERRGRGERRSDRPYERRPQSGQGNRRINQPK